MITTHDLDLYDRETDRLREELKTNLAKFNDLDLLFTQAEAIVRSYFENQSTYTHLDDFREFLKSEIIFYVQSFWKPRKEKKPIRSRLIDIETRYADIIHFGETEENDSQFQIVDLIGSTKGRAGKIV